MSRQLVAGNWKMNLTRAEAVALAQAVVAQQPSADHVDLVVCPPSVYLLAVAEVVASSPVELGAQNVYHEPQGAFTGEVSPVMLKDVGCRYVILGHSERRHVMGETDQQVNLKLHAALAAELTPIVCVGELLEERESGRTGQVIRSQIAGSLAKLDEQQVPMLVIAYEPVWAIGTGRVATPKQAEEVHLDLRKVLTDHYNEALAHRVRILYGGSVKPDNAAQLLAQPNVDGVLVGGASLKAGDFLAIAAAGRR